MAIFWLSAWFRLHNSVLQQFHNFVTPEIEFDSEWEKNYLEFMKFIQFDNFQ